MLSMFFEPETGVSLQHAKHPDHISIGFEYKIYWENQSILSMRCRSNSNWFLEQNFLGDSKVYWKSRCYAFFASQKRGVPLQNTKLTGLISLDFYCKIYWEIKSILSARYRSTFSLFLVQNLLVKSKVYWNSRCYACFASKKLGSHSRMQNLQVQFHLSFSTTFTGKFRSILSARWRSTFNWFKVHNLLVKSKV